jgi:hypothetical protein
VLAISRYETAALAFQGLEMRFALASLGAKHAAAYKKYVSIVKYRSNEVDAIANRLWIITSS